MVDWQLVKYLCGIAVGLLFLFGFLYWDWSVVAVAGSLYFFAHYVSKILMKIFGRKDNE